MFACTYCVVTVFLGSAASTPLRSQADIAHSCLQITPPALADERPVGELEFHERVTQNPAASQVFWST